MFSLQPAGMVVHISAGHHTGTLVNALLHHCGLPGILIDQVASGRQSGKGDQPDADSEAQFLENKGAEAAELLVTQDNEYGGPVTDDEDEEEGRGPSFLPSSTPQAGGVLRPGRRTCLTLALQFSALY
jgi:hypothetical protein